VAALLLLALAAPVAGALAAVVLPERAVTVGRVAALVAAVCWFALLLDASSVSSGRFHSLPLVAAAGCGTALVAAAVDAAALQRPALAGVALAGASFALAAGRTATDGAGLAAGLAVAAVAALAAVRPTSREWLPAVAGVVAVAVGVVALRAAANSWQLPLADGALVYRGEGLLLLFGAALVVVAGSQWARRPAALLVPLGLFVAAQAAPVARGSDGVAPATVLLALAAAAAALAARAGRPLLDRPTAALALFALAALIGPGVTRPAGLLLAAGATLASTSGSPAAAALGFPGGVALAVGLAARGGPTAFLEGALAAVVVLALAAGALRGGTPARPPAWMAPVLFLGAWLLVAPGSWAWAGPAGLGPYDLGAGRAVAAAALCLVVLAHTGRGPAGWYARAFPPDSPGEDAVRH
jgi:hypothetical protein